MPASPTSPSAPGPARVGLVVVSHSEPLARAAVSLSAQMLHGEDLTIEVAAGVDGGFGTDAIAIKDAIEHADSPAGVLVLVDMGSAVLSTELAIEMLDDPTLHERVTVSPAPLVEGLVAAAVSAAGGAPLDEVDTEARGGIAAKLAHLGGDDSADVLSVRSPAERPDATAVVAVFRVRNAHGLHARPAARLVNEVRKFDAEVELTNLTAAAGPVPADSLSRVATLGARTDHEIRMTAVGRQAQDAVNRLVSLAERRFDEPDRAATPVTVLDHGGQSSDDSPAGPRTTPGSPGVAVGPARQLVPAPVEAEAEPVGTPTDEWDRLEDARETVRREIRHARDLAARTAGDSEAAIFDAHLTLLDDSAILDTVRDLVDGGTGAAAAWSETLTEVQRTWAELSDAYLRERTADIAALRQQVLESLTGVAEFEMPAAGILIAKDLTPAQTARLDPALVRGILLAEGSPSSHAAILARGRGIPLVVSAGGGVLAVPEETSVVLDGTTGEFHIAPAAEVVARFEARAAEQRELHRAQVAEATRTAVSADGARVIVGANLGSVADAEAGRAMGADKAGLVRTEFLFLDRDTAPDADEQTTCYLGLATAMGGRPLTLRTLDVGGDKPLSYLPERAEPNPFLGRRGVRLSLHHRDLLRTQLRAICRAARDARINVMVPMVSTPAELVAVRTLLDDAAGPDGVPERLRFGMMVEVPSAALKMEAFAPHVDFVSIGTNDLTQYAMAAERGNADVGELNDPVDPGVLRLIGQVATATTTGVAVGVCGEAAADPVAVPLLVGLGIRDLSVSPPAVPRVKEQVRMLDATQCAALADRALGLDDAAQVRALVRKELAP